MPVYEPQEDSELLCRFVENYAAGDVLDMGAGSGILTFAAARKRDVKSVVAVDIDDDALAFVLETAKNEATDIREKIVLRKSNLFSNVGNDEYFETIVCNPPYLPDEEKDEHPALYGGPQGWEFIERFLDGAKQHLKKDGHILLLFSSLTNKERVIQLMKNERFHFTELAVEYHFFEQLYIYRLWRDENEN